ncbi:MAG TPA: branched-chain amino acid ABC transporter permease [Gemmatimonadaceae bacterium]|nr:branched-chain amino acid ABC transporter permease [Gemmatimonadaceae bacterium]
MDEVIRAIGFGLVTSSVIALGAVGFTLQFSVSRLFNVAYGAAMTVAAYVAYLGINQLGAGIWVSLVVAALAAAAVSVALQRGIYQPFIAKGSNHFALIMVSLAMAVIIQETIQAISGPRYVSLDLPHQTAFHVGSIVLTPRQLVIVAIALVTMILLHWLLRSTRLGKAMRAVADDPDLAQSSGIKSRRVISIVWFTSGALCGLAGATLVLNTVTFNTNVGSLMLLVIVAAAMLGGVGDIYGAVLGSVVVGVVSELTALWAPQLKNFSAFVVLVIILIVLPEGLRPTARLGRRVAA